MESFENFTYQPIRDAYTEEIRKNSIAPRQSNAQMVVHPSNCVVAFKFREEFPKIWNFKVYPDDTWVVTYPKSGTTWTQEMVWLLKNNLDYEEAKKTNLRFRFPFIDLDGIISDNKNNEESYHSIETAENLKRPRCIKSHLPLELLPKALWTVKPKIIYVSRDPRDVAISYYHHYRLWNGYQGTLEAFTESFLADRLIYSPFWSHNISFWNLKDKSHVLINSYEEMKKDLAGVIRKTAKFLEVEISEQQVEELKQHLSFNNMKNNKSVNYSEVADEVKQQFACKDEGLVFIRKGESGGYAKTFSKEMLEKFRKWTEEGLAGTPYKEYPYSVNN